MSLREILQQHKDEFYPVMPVGGDKKNLLAIDLSSGNNELLKLDLADTGSLHDYIFGKIKASGAIAGIGGYLEHRDWYRRSDVFKDDDNFRCIHLGIDIWMQEGTPVASPLEGIVHSMANNNSFANYGGTIILQHELNGVKFFTLYGHLSLKSLDHIKEGMPIEKGQVIGWLGAKSENGNWPPHLHFQIMNDMLGNYGDFPGVCGLDEQVYYKTICPDPNFILNYEILKII